MLNLRGKEYTSPDLVVQQFFCKINLPRLIFLLLLIPSNKQELAHLHSDLC
jgi:hypothetical protein